MKALTTSDRYAARPGDRTPRNYPGANGRRVDGVGPGLKRGARRAWCVSDRAETGVGSVQGLPGREAGAARAAGVKSNCPPVGCHGLRCPGERVRRKVPLRRGVSLVVTDEGQRAVQYYPLARARVVHPT